MKTKFTKNKNKNKNREKTQLVMPFWEAWSFGKKPSRKSTGRPRVNWQSNYNLQSKGNRLHGWGWWNADSNQTVQTNWNNTSQTGAGYSRSLEGVHLPLPHQHTWKSLFLTAAVRCAWKDLQGKVACSKESQVQSCASNISISSEQQQGWRWGLGERGKERGRWRLY